MKVILLRDVARLGRKSEIKDVPDGHAINFLIPRKLAVLASGENLKRVQEGKSKHESHTAATAAAFSAALAAFAEAPVAYPAPANEQGHLFKGVRAEDVAAFLNKHGFTLTKQDVLLKTPIKDVGVHAVPLTVAGVRGEVSLEVRKG